MQTFKYCVASVKSLLRIFYPHPTTVLPMCPWPLDSIRKPPPFLWASLQAADIQHPSFPSPHELKHPLHNFFFYLAFLNHDWKKKIRLEKVGGKLRALLFSQKPSVSANTTTTPFPLSPPTSPPPPPQPNKYSLNQPDKLEIDIVDVRLRLFRININSLSNLSSSRIMTCICGSSCSVWGIISLIRRQARAWYPASGYPPPGAAHGG